MLSALHKAITGGSEAIQPEIVNSNAVGDKATRPFPKTGITLTGINSFIALCGGKDALEGLTTTQVCVKFMMELTQASRMSYCDQLLSTGTEGNIVGRATVFISHAWKYLFNNVVDALTIHFASAPDTVLWFDLFSNNQHGLDEPPPFEWWCETFMGAIRDIGHVVMIMEPWENPVPLTRAWCLWEVYCTLSSKSKFEVAMSRIEKQRFRSMIVNDSGEFYRMLANVNVRKSEAFNPNDRIQIFDVIQRTVGFEDLNHMVVDCLSNWVIEDVLLHITELEANTELESAEKLSQVLTAKNALGLLYKDRGRYDKAEEIHKEVWEIRKEKFGENHETTVNALTNLAIIYDSQGKYAEAEVMFRQCVDRWKEVHGPDHYRTLNSMNSLAIVYKNRGKYHDAEVMHNECLEKRRAALGATHPSTLVSMTNLAILYDAQGKYVEAERMFKQCVDTKTATLGIDHPDTLNSMNSLAIVYKNLKKYTEAEALQVTVLAKRRELLGSDHPSTIGSMSNLAILYDTIKNFAKAEVLFSECLEKNRLVLGAEHPSTLNSMNSLAIVYKNLNRYPDAERLHRECLAKREAHLGRDHPSTLASICNLAIVLDMSGKYAEGERLFRECLEKRRVVLGENHPSTVSTINSLGIACKNLGRKAEADALFAEYRSKNK